MRAFVSTKDVQETPHFFVKEDASWCGRTFSCLAPGCRATTYTVHRGADSTGPAFIRHEKQCTFGMRQWIGCIIDPFITKEMFCFWMPCCCNLPYLDTYDTATNQKIGSSRVICDSAPFCHPKFAVFDKGDKPVYRIHPDLCICNQCFVCCKCEKGQRCCFNPYYFRDPDTMERVAGGDDDTAIIDLWAGLAKECCAKKNVYGVKFPPGVDDDMRATIMGTTILYDLSLIEQSQ